MLLLLLSHLLLASAQTGGWTFHDDFESGALDPAHWTPGGRDLSGTGVVNVVARGGSLSGHVYHSSFTEKYVASRQFPATGATRFDFDMEVRATDPGSPGGAYYAYAGAYLSVFDGTNWGTVEVIASTSTYRSSLYANDPLHTVVAIPQSLWQSHSYSGADLAALLPGINAAEIQAISAIMISYCSWWNGAANGDVWFDNFTISGIPADLQVLPAQPTAGAYASFTATGMSPGAWAYLALSRIGPGSTPVPPLGLDLDIAQGFQAAPRTRVAADGSAVWTILIPSPASGRSAWFQAAEIGRSTRVLAVNVL